MRNRLRIFGSAVAVLILTMGCGDRVENRKFNFNRENGFLPPGATLVDDMIIRNEDQGKIGTSSVKGTYIAPWPDGIVNIFIDPVVFAPEQRNKIIAGCRVWEAHANVKCVPWSGINLSNCSLLGTPGYQTGYNFGGGHCIAIPNDTHIVIVLGAPNEQPNMCGVSDLGAGNGWKDRGMTFFSRFFNEGIDCSAHEFGHLFGLHHEHQRTDRDQFIKINWSNVKPGFEEAFSKFNDSWEPSTNLTPYDFLSIMHYPAFGAGSAIDRNQPVILPQPGYENFGPVIGSNLHSPTALDGQGLAKIYGLPGGGDRTNCRAEFYYEGTHNQLSHQSGYAIGTSWGTDVAQPRNNYLTYGPNAEDVCQGNAIARFKLQIDNNSADNLKVATIDVFNSNSGLTLRTRDITRQEFSSANTAIDFELSFYNPPGSSLEYRVYYHGSSALRHIGTYVKGPAPYIPPPPTTVDRTVIGNIDGVVESGFQNYLVGWACAKTSASPIAVHLYAGGQAGVGKFVTAVTANASSEPSVANVCQSNGTAYRFAIPLDNYRAKFSQKSLYVHGISPFGLANNVIGNSGIYEMPLATALQAEDFNGDRRADYAVFRPSNATWYVRNQFTLNYGGLGDIPIAGNFSNTTKADLVVLRSSNYNWYINHVPTQWGIDGDIPTPADFDGDGKTDIAVWRPSNGTWYIRNSSNGTTKTQQWGTPGDIPILADFDGDRKIDVAVWRPSTATWYVINSSNSTQLKVAYGVPSDIPAAADYNGDGKAEIAVWRPSTGVWHINGVGSYQWGSPSDIPLVGDFNGDGKSDRNVWRPNTGTWYIYPTGSSSWTSTQWGLPGDQPL